MLEAFFVSLGWDTRDFDRGRRQVDKDFSDTKENARKAAGDIEDAGKRAASFFRSLRNETVGLFLAFQGASSLKSFLGDLIDTAAGTDRVAKNLGVARNELYAFQNLLKSNGGTAADATGAIGTLANQIQSWRLGIRTGNEGNLAGLGVTSSDFTSPTDLLLKISEAAGRMDRPQFANRLGMLGFSPELIDLLSKGRAEVEKQLRQQERQAELTDDQVQAAQRFQRELANLQTTITGKVLPALTPLIGAINDLLSGTRGFVDIGPNAQTAIIALGTAAALAAPPWFRLAAAIWAAKAAGDSFLKNHPSTTRFLDEIEAPFRAVLPEWMFKRPDDVNAAAYGSSGGGGGSAPAGGGTDIQSYLTSRGVSAEVARGIAAGVYAEGGTATAVNPKSGAFGIGQWLGPRRARLFARYGRKPTMAQQLEFLLWELQGGDSGGASVLGAGNAGQAGYNYITQFMRPGAGYETQRDLAAVRSFLGMRAPVSGSGGGSSTVNINIERINTPDAKSFAESDLPTALKRRAPVIQATTGVSR